jgi:cobalt/nickel transport system permease protein
LWFFILHIIFLVFRGKKMHIPDNYLSPSTCAVLGAAMLPIWKRTVAKVKEEVTRKKLPLLGIGAAFSFLIMMFNIPLPGGTTGHAVGGTLIAILVGPYAACISVTIALLIQAFVFGDGGILAFGANSFNLAFVLPFSGYYIYNFIKNRLRSEKADIVAAFIAAYCALNIAALLTALQFGIQPYLFKDAAGLPIYCPYPISIAVPAMVIPHLLAAGFVEAIATVGVYSFIKRVSPGMIYESGKSNAGPVYSLLIVMIMLSPLGLLAAGTAWGEWGTDEISEAISGGSALGYTPKGMKEGFSFKAVAPDYTIGGISETLAYILSAAAGVAILIILFKLLLRGKGKGEGV